MHQQAAECFLFVHFEDCAQRTKYTQVRSTLCTPPPPTTVETVLQNEATCRTKDVVEQRMFDMMATPGISCHLMFQFAPVAARRMCMMHTSSLSSSDHIKVHCCYCTAATWRFRVYFLQHCRSVNLKYCSQMDIYIMHAIPELEKCSTSRTATTATLYIYYSTHPETTLRNRLLNACSSSSQKTV